MVAAYCDTESSSCQFVVRPNYSLTWRGTVIFYLGICTVSLTIAVLFAVAGAWPVLPFAGLELTALGIALYIVALRAGNREVISIHGDTVEVQRGRKRPEQVWRFSRHWIQVVLEKPQETGHPKRLFLRANGRQLEIGRCLDDEERLRLAAELKHRIQSGCGFAGDEREAEP